MGDKSVAYIYSYKKAQFFIRNGHDLLERPAPATKGDVCYKFKKDGKLLETTKKWQKTIEFIEKIKK